jgi:hypothetical protein
MNVKDLLTLAYITPDQYIEVPEAPASAALAGDLVIVTVQPPLGDNEVTVSVHSHGGDREAAAACFGRLREAFDRSTAEMFAHELSTTPVTGGTFV